MAKRATKTGRARKRRPEWEGFPSSKAVIDGHVLTVGRTGGGGQTLIEWVARVDGATVGRDFSPLGAQYLAEDALTGLQEG